MILIEIYGTTGVNARFISLLIVQIKVSRRETFKVIFPVNSRFWPNDDK